LLLSVCKDCLHSQQNFIVPPNKLFQNYSYVSGVGKTVFDYCETVAKIITNDLENPKSKKILDIACNDGSQLDAFKKLGWETYGVDPAENIVPIAIEKGHKVKIGFWGTNSFDLPIFDAIIAQNVFAHVSDPISFLKECFNHMDSNSKLYIQTSQANMYVNSEFDTIYHEHISFFSAKSFKKAAEIANLDIVDIGKIPIHGTSFFVTFKKKNNFECTRLSSFIKEEEETLTDEFFESYRTKILKVKEWTNDAISKEGYNVVAYGAAAKGMILIKYFDIHSKIDYIVDDSIHKQGKYTPSTNIKIVSSDEFYKDERNLIILILAWNISDEIISNIKKNRKNKTIIVCPYPNSFIEVLQTN